MKLIFASNNAHKLEEVRKILPDMEIVSLREIGLHADIPETSDTLEGNSLQKAEYVYQWLGNHANVLGEQIVGCFADDTGLEIKALDGKPGVHSARWASDENDPVANREKTLRLMNGVEDRSAQFRTVITLYYWGDAGHTFEAPQKEVFEGIVKGWISTEEKGDHGFGYDPIYVPEGYDEPFAVLPAEVKNSISHRARALAKLVDFFQK